jgi:hypothetical protein
MLLLRLLTRPAAISVTPPAALLHNAATWLQTLYILALQEIQTMSAATGPVCNPDNIATVQGH